MHWGILTGTSGPYLSKNALKKKFHCTHRGGSPKDTTAFNKETPCAAAERRFRKVASTLWQFRSLCPYFSLFLHTNTEEGKKVILNTRSLIFARITFFALIYKILYYPDPFLAATYLDPIACQRTAQY